MAARLLGRFGLYEGSPSTSRYVTLLGATLAARVGRPELVFRFAVLNSGDPGAYATPGGYVFVTRGLLASLKSESELAGVLAHEIAHVNERHMYLELMPDREVSTGEAVVRLLSMGKGDVSGSLSQMVDQGLKMLLEDGLGAEKEKAADEAAVHYAAAFQYEPASLRIVIERLKATAREKQQTELAARVANLKAYIKREGMRTEPAAAPRPLAARFERAMRPPRAVAGEAPP